jgi:hypothetical protein
MFSDPASASAAHRRVVSACYASGGRAQGGDDGSRSAPGSLPPMGPRIDCSTASNGLPLPTAASVDAAVCAALYSRAP